MKQMEKTYKKFLLSCLYVVPCFVIISTVFLVFNRGFSGREDVLEYHETGRHLLAVNETNDTLITCIPSGIHSFPSDFFTQEQRRMGGVLVHILIAAYVCAMIGVVCHGYFVPSLEIISDRLKLPPDIAGATFMAIGTSAPELFSSILGSFVAEDDIGVGTIIGSAVFNIVGVTGLVGVVLWTDVLDIDWYPIARDCTAYGFTVLTLIWIISDNIVTWWESLILLFIFFLYIFIIYFNSRIEVCARGLANSIKRSKCICCCCTDNEEASSLISEKIFVPEISECQRHIKRLERDSFSVEFTASRENSVLGKEPMQTAIEEMLSSGQGTSSLCKPPNTDSCWKLVWWGFMFPARLLFYVTIPDSSQERLQKFYPVTFTMSVIWIGVLSYMAVWMVTVIGYTLSIPDSVSGLTILAAGTSVPELISSVIVAKNGFGNMAISNLVGSNTFDISFCLGAPWLLKTLLSKRKYLLVFSSALTYTTATLLLTLVVFVAVFGFSGWKLNRTVGLVFFGVYGIFVVLACMYELNVFGEINVKTCDY
ncbi:hypothetical protein JTE90_009720 [Oedothorax gibbosus]|uniref:Sodium/calcium exchanger membrane region domain-containing protein n=1 Tax=Oedothorax gibbosus TaxID=931172 RepID=A0AAV6V9T8_9ARAC|nr:hypothetical protein JTE90_009720 [Oedothorax gibbosus]